MNHRPEQPVQPGQILAGKYRIERVLGIGGMGVVVSAHHLRLDDHVAIKFLLPSAMESTEAVARFDREARAAVKIKSEHIARVSDVGTLENGAPYMVMEYLNGQDLAQVLEVRGQLTVEDATDYLLQACEAIAEAHTLGIVHRDLKPANLFLTHRPDGSSCVKVLDFGISKLTNAVGGGSSRDQAMTRTAAIIGSPLYMSPEQLSSARDVDMRTDIWALGVILFELLTGRPPFMADGLPQLVRLIMLEPPPAARNFRPDLPEGLGALIEASLRNEREQRLQTVADFASRLVEFAPKRSRLSAERISNLTRAAGIHTQFANEPLPPSVAPLPARTIADFARTTSAKPWRAAGLGAALLAVVVVCGVLVGYALVREPKAELATQLPSGAASAAPRLTPQPVVEPVPSPPALALVTPSVAPASSALLAESEPSSSARNHAAPIMSSHPVAPALTARPKPTPAASHAPGTDWGGRL